MNSTIEHMDYVEFNVSDMDASKNFYANAFGWTFTDYGSAYTEFSDGRLKGGMSLSESVQAKGGPLIVLYSQALEACQQKIEAAGGIVVKQIFAFPGGRRFHFTDPDGYELAVWSDQ